MTASERIVEQILLDAKKEAQTFKDEATDKAEKIVAEAKVEAEEIYNSLSQKADQKVSRINDSASSNGELTIRNALLQGRREEIDKTLSALLSYLLDLSENDYFSLLLKLVKSAKQDGEGQMLLNSKDLARLPDSFKAEMDSLNIKICPTANDTISGGFILKYSDIEMNEDFEAIIDDKKEKLEDFISNELF